MLILLRQAPELAGAVLGLEAIVRIAAQAISVGLQQAPGIAKAMWPSGTTDSQIFQISALDEQLSAAVNQVETVINNGLGLIMSDLPTFVNFASSGAFSGSQSMSLPNETQGLDFALKTYMTSESLLQNGWVGVLEGTYTADQTTTMVSCAPVTGGKLCAGTGDQSQYSKSAGSFWDQNTGRLYTLLKTKGDSYSYPILSAINVNGWADLGTLFDGAYSCTADGTFTPYKTS